MRLTKEKKVLIGKIGLIIGLLLGWIFVFCDLGVAFNNTKETLWVHVPSVVEEGEEFTINVEAWDEFERLAGGYDGEISFDIVSYNLTTLEKISAIHDLPGSKEFTTNFIWGGLIPAYKTEGADNGLKSSKARIFTQGIHYIIVEEKDTENIYRSNPIIVKPEGSDINDLYWGDLHGHTLYSDGSGLPSESYEFARDVSLLDFASLTDHAEHFPRMGEADVFNTYQNYIDITNSFNDAGAFVTIVAVEYTPYYIVRGSSVAHGHYNVYFKGDNMPFFSTYTHLNPEELFEYIEKNTKDDYISWLHHPLIGLFTSDYAFYDEDVNPLIEIYSVHGSSETFGDDNLYNTHGEMTDPGYSIRDALKMGRKFGIMAAGDNHDGRLGHSISHTPARAYNQYPFSLSGYRKGHPFPNGLTGIFTNSLTRNSVFNALKTRSCIASTWVTRPYINFTINGLSVGVNDSTLYVPKANSTREIDLLLCSDGISMKENERTEISEVEIFKNSKSWKHYKNINKPVYKIAVNDTVNITGTSYKDCIKKDGKWYIHEQSIKAVDPDDLNTGGLDYYYVRMLDSNDQTAWIGPIWVGVES